MPGTIEKRGASYRLTVYNGFDTNGKRIKHRKTIHCNSEREAKKELALFYSEIQKGYMYNNKEVSFSEYTTTWLNEYAEPNLAPRTVERYMSMLKCHILPEFGNMKLSKITPFHLTKLLNKLANKKTTKKDINGNFTLLSENSISKVFKLISIMFNTAVNWGLLSYNICKNIKHPKETRTEMSFYSIEEVEELLKSLEKEPLKYQTIVSMAVMSGLRRGELLGLYWSDIDFNTGTVKIERSLQYLSGKGFLEKSPKTSNGKRTITLPKYCLNLLKQLKKETLMQRLLLGNKYNITDYIFVTKDGNNIHPDTITSWFSKFLKRNGLKKIRFHDLRHTSATILLSKGMNIKAVSNQLGHSNISITNRYVHVLEKDKKEIADVFDSIANC